MVKSQLESQWTEHACAITSEAYAKTFTEIQSGMTESEIESMMLYHMLALGAKSPWVLVTSGEGNYDLVSKGGGRRKVSPGDMVWMDAGCSYNGYCSDFSRAGVLGGPSKPQEEGQRIIHELTEVGVGMLRPGMPVTQIAAQLNEAVDGLDLAITSSISGLAGRVGHGMGMFVTEPPSISEEDPTNLEEGMIVTMEPGVATKYGTFHVEENVLITADEPRLLSSSHWQLWAI